MKTYVSDIVKNEYKEWEKEGVNTVFIEAPTGSGKTSFILHKLLPNVAEKGKSMIYLVNRTILKKQLDAEVEREYAGNSWIKNKITIELYQKLEENLLRYKKAGDVFDNAEYVICDECHYFLMDSNYNTNTIKSFQWVIDNMDGRISIFMSATIDDVKECVKEAQERRKYCFTDVYRYQFPFHKKGRSDALNKVLGGRVKAVVNPVREYDDKLDYGYVKIGIIDDLKKLVDLVGADKGKWVIFIDNIEFGKRLKRELREVIRKKDIKNREVVMITKDYDQDDVGWEEVETITLKNKSKAQILISTCVMDNGISIHDIELRNMVILADNKTEFIQMLGRKREDGKPLQLFIYKQPRTHFSFRLNQILRTQRLIKEYTSDFSCQIEYPLTEAKRIFGNVPFKRQYQADLLFLLQTKKIEDSLPPISDTMVLVLRQKISYLESMLNMHYEVTNSDIIRIEDEMREIECMSNEEKQDLRTNLLFLNFDLMKEKIEAVDVDAETKKKTLKQAAQKLILFYGEMFDINYDVREMEVVSLWNQLEKWLISKQHEKFLGELINRETSFEDISSIFYTENGLLHLNRLSVKNLELLGGRYQEILEEYEEYGEDAFLREQLKWLGKKGDEIKTIIEEAKNKDVERSLNVVIRALKEIDGKEQPKKDVIDLKVELKPYLRTLVKNLDKELPGYATILDAVNKKDRPLSVNNIQFLRTHYDFPFSLKEKNGKYTFESVENEIIPQE